jgi:hypothetical protein
MCRCLLTCNINLKAWSAYHRIHRLAYCFLKCSVRQAVNFQGLAGDFGLADFFSAVAAKHKVRRRRRLADHLTYNFFR